MRARNVDEFLAAGKEGTASIERQVTSQLDALAKTLQDRMDSAKIPNTDSGTALGLLMSFMFDEEGFRESIAMSYSVPTVSRSCCPTMFFVARQVLPSALLFSSSLYATVLQFKWMLSTITNGKPSFSASLRSRHPSLVRLFTACSRTSYCLPTTAKNSWHAMTIPSVRHLN